MKKLVLILAAGFAALSLQAQLTTNNPQIDQFANATGSGGSAYTAGTTLVGQTNAQGFVWVGAGTGTGTNQPVITNINLSVPGLRPGSGNAVNFGTPAGTDAILQLPGATKIQGTNVNLSVYYSMAFQVNSLGTLTASPVFVAAFESNVTPGQTGQPGVVSAKLFLCKNGSGYNIGIGKDATLADYVWEGGATNGATYNLGTTYFIVACYTFSGSENGSDTVSLWVNPATNTFGAATAPTGDPSYVSTSTLADHGGTDINATPANDYISGFELRQGLASEPSSMTADELRIGLTWADVTPPPGAVTVFTNLTVPTPITYGSTVALSGTVVAPGPLYPATNEPVYININGNVQSTTVTDAFGDFSINYTSTAPTSAVPYTITYTYLGDTALDGVADTSTTLTVSSPLPVIISGSRMYDGTATAAAAMLFVSNSVGSDVLTIGGGPATLAGSSAGVEAITGFGTLTLSGAPASNYTMTGVSGSVDIATPPLSVGHPAFDPFADATASGGTAYNVGDYLVGETNAQGLSWYAVGNGAGEPTVAPGSLSVPGLIPDTGNSINYGAASGTSARLDLGATPTNSTFFGGSSYTVYYSMSFLVQETNDLTATPAIIAGFTDAAGTQTNAASIIGARLYIRLSGSGYNLGIDKADGITNDIVWETNTYAVNTTNFIVAGYTFSGSASSSNDSVSLWVNPSSATFGAGSPPIGDPSYLASSAGANIGGNSTADKIGGFLLREASTTEPAYMTIDEVSVGLSWADVTPSSAVAPTAVPLHVALSGGNAVLSWTTNSSGFRLQGAPNVINSNAWTNVTASTNIVGTNYTVSDPIHGLNYYRLIYP